MTPTTANTPCFAEYVLASKPDWLRVDWPWAHERLPLNPLFGFTVGVDPRSEIVVHARGTPDLQGFGGRRNHRLWFLEGSWFVEDLGNVSPVTVNGERVMRRSPLNHGDTICPAPTLTFTYVEPAPTLALWAQAPAAMLEAVNATREPYDASGVPEGRYRHWLELPVTPERAVLEDWLRDQGVSERDVPVELVHLLAWHRRLR